MQYLGANTKTLTFTDEQGTTQRYFHATPQDRHFNTFKYAEFRNNPEYREYMWQNAGRNLLPDAPTPAQLALYNERQAVLLRETAINLALFAVGGGLNYAGVKALNRYAPAQVTSTLSRQEVGLPDLRRLVDEHSSAGSGGHTGMNLTQEAAIKAMQLTQPTGTRAVVAGQGAPGPDVTFVRLSDNVPVETVQYKTASNPNSFEAAIRADLVKPVSPTGGSNVIVVMYPNADDAGRLLGKLANNFDPAKVAGRSILVLDPAGRIIIPLQPFPKKP
jgi:hypothetical protein